MNTVKLWRLVVIFTLVLTLLPTGATRAAPAAAETSLANLVNADGTLRLDGTFHGALDVSGWQVHLDPARGPVFAADAGLHADPQWNALGELPNGVLGSTVSALAVSGTDVYVGGQFSNAGGVAAADRIAKWDGTTWSALGSNGAGDGALNATVNALAISGTDVYVGGAFTDAGGVAEADYVAQWDGSVWSALGSNGSGNGALGSTVYALAVSGTDLYVGGSFQNAGGVAEADYVAQWDGSVWSALGSNGSGNGALTSRVYALAVSGTDLYVGGNFQNAGGSAEADYLAQWNGTTWSALGSNGSGDGALNDSVSALALSETGVLYVGGDFENAGGSAAADYIAQWDGANWSALGSNGSGDGALGSTVYALAVSGTDLYVGGFFQNAGGSAEADRVAQWDGTTWSALGSNGSGDGALGSVVYALAVSGTDDVYVGGFFTDAAGNTAADRIAQWDGSAWSALGSALDGALNSYVFALAISGTDVYVGGRFTNIGGVAEADRIAKWDGATWSALGSNGAGDGALSNDVNALALSGTDLYVGGGFQNAGGVAEADYVAKWDGSVWSALGSNGSGNGALTNWVNALALSGTDVYVGGDFTNAGGIAEADYIAQWDGSAWSALGSNGSGNGALGGEVNALAVSGTDLYVGGGFGFTNVGGVAEADYIAKWDGTTWSALGSNGSGDGALDNSVYALVVSGTAVYVGGYFQNAAGVAEADYVAQWDGTQWNALGSNGAGDGALGWTVVALAVSGTEVYVGGLFTNAAGVAAADRVAQWDGSAWSALGSNGSGDGALNTYVRVLVISGTGDLYVGGEFTNAGGVAAADYIARWGEPAAASSTCTATGNGDWSNPATWSCGHVPGAGEDVSIPAGFTVTLDVDISLDSDLDVQGTLAPNGKTVTLTGDQAQALSGNLTFHHLTINKTNAADTVTVTSGKLTSTGRTRIRKGKLITASDYEDLEIEADGTLQLGNDITIGGNLIVAGTLDTNGFGVTFDGAKEQNLTLDHVTTFNDLTVAAGTTLIETDSGDHAPVLGTLTNNGVIRKTQMIDAVTDYYFGLASQDELLIEVTDDSFTSITVERRDQNHAGRTGTGAPPAAGVGWGIYWTITPVGSGEADLILPHTLEAAHAHAQACRFISGTTWDCARTSSDDWTVTRAGVTAFSDWAVGNDVKGNAVTLRDFRAAPGFDLAAWLRNLLRR